jgi:hypothetical protein
MILPRIASLPPACRSRHTQHVDDTPEAAFGVEGEGVLAIRREEQVV